MYGNFFSETAVATVVTLKDLPDDFTDEQQIITTQLIGSKWYMANKDLLLEVPSAIIPSENNFIINTMHEDLKK